MMMQDAEKLKEALASAALHASQVSGRGSFVPERTAVLGEFITSLRRECRERSIGNPMRDHLTSKYTWDDVLILKDNHKYPDLTLAVRLAREELLDSGNENYLAVRLENALSTVRASEYFIERARDLNKQADEIVKEFGQLIDDMQKSA